MLAGSMKRGVARPVGRVSALVLTVLAVCVLALAVAPRAEAKISTRYESRAAGIGKDMRGAYLDVRDMNDVRAADAWRGPATSLDPSSRRAASDCSRSPDG